MAYLGNTIVNGNLKVVNGINVTGTLTQNGTAVSLNGHTHNYAAASHGNHVPATQTANNAIFLRNDNTWQTVTPANIGAAAASHSHSYLPLSGGTLTGGTKFGSSSQSAFPTVGILVHDVRSVNFTPGALDNGVNFFFSNNNMPNTHWWAGMHVKGWTGGYNAWDIIGPAHDNDSRTVPLYVRTSNGSSAWGSWRKIYDSSNKPTLAELGAAASSHSHSYLPLAGGTLTGVLTTKGGGVSWIETVNNANGCAIEVPNTGAYGWIRGKTKNGKIVISTYANSDDRIYIGYAETGRTTNSYTRQIYWDGSNGSLTMVGTSGTSYIQLPSGIKLY